MVASNKRWIFHGLMVSVNLHVKDAAAFHSFHVFMPGSKRKGLRDWCRRYCNITIPYSIAVASIFEVFGDNKAKASARHCPTNIESSSKGHGVSK